MGRPQSLPLYGLGSERSTARRRRAQAFHGQGAGQHYRHHADLRQDRSVQSNRYRGDDERQGALAHRYPDCGGRGPRSARRGRVRRARSLLGTQSELDVHRLVPGDKALDAAPGVLRGAGELLGLAVKEAVRRTRINDELILDAALVQLTLEGLDGLDRDALVGPTEEPEHRTLNLTGPVQRRSDRAKMTREVRVETDDPGEIVPTRAGPEGERPSHAETDGKGGEILPHSLSNLRDRGIEVGTESLRGHLLHMGHVVERLGPIVVLGGAAEVVDDQSALAGIGESQGQSLIEIVQAAHIGKDDHLTLSG